MNAIDYLKNNKNDNKVIKKSFFKNPETLEPIDVTVDDVIYKKSKENKKNKKNEILREKIHVNPNGEPNKNNKNLLIEYIIQETKRINDLDYL